MINIISFSGGRTSAYLVYKVLKDIDKNAKVIFMDTGAEHPKTYKFLKEVSNNWGVKITCLRLKTGEQLGKSNSYEIININDCKQDLIPFKDMLKKYGTPYVSGGNFCTREMKERTFKRYCKEKYGNDYITWLGMRIDEPRRMIKRNNCKYLGDISNKEKIDIIAWWRKQKFDLEIKEHLGNCVFCIKKTNLKIALAIKDEPEMYEDFINIIYSSETRIDENRKTKSDVMYRGYNSLTSIKRMYDSFTREEIAKLLNGSKSFDSGSCSESCEVF